MNRAEIEQRWGQSLESLLLDLAAQGLSLRDAAAALGAKHSLVRSAVTDGRITGIFEQSPKRSAVAIRFGMPFWVVVWTYAHAGLNRSQLATFLGFNRRTLSHMFDAAPELDPWPPGVVSQFIRDTGQPFIEQVREMAAKGMTAYAIGVQVGYSPNGPAGDCLRLALKSRGVTDIVFARRAARVAVQVERGPKWYSKHRGGPKGIGWGEKRDLDLQRASIAP